MSLTRAKYPCCRDPLNRALVEVQRENDEQRFHRLSWLRQQLIERGWLPYPQRVRSRVEQCRVCRRRHITAMPGMVFRPGKVGIQ